MVWKRKPAASALLSPVRPLVAGDSLHAAEFSRRRRTCDTSRCCAVEPKPPRVGADEVTAGRVGARVARQRGRLRLSACGSARAAARARRRQPYAKVGIEIVGEAAPCGLAVLRAVGARACRSVPRPPALMGVARPLPREVRHAAGERRREGRAAHQHQPDIFRSASSDPPRAATGVAMQGRLDQKQRKIRLDGAPEIAARR